MRLLSYRLYLYFSVRFLCAFSISLHFFYRLLLSHSFLFILIFFVSYSSSLSVLIHLSSSGFIGSPSSQLILSYFLFSVSYLYYQFVLSASILFSPSLYPSLSFSFSIARLPDCSYNLSVKYLCFFTRSIHKFQIMFQLKSETKSKDIISFNKGIKIYYKRQIRDSNIQRYKNKSHILQMFRTVM